MTRFRGPAPGETIALSLETLLVVYHRPSGQTHLLAQPLPEVLTALGSGAAALPDLLARLDVSGGPDAGEALAARLAELEALGLVDCVA